MRPLQQILVEGNSDDGIIVYHASRRRFSNFNDGKIRNALTAGFGHYFTESPDLAVRFLNDRSGFLYKVRLNVTDDELAYAFQPLGQQPNALRAFENVVKTFNPKQDDRMFSGIDPGRDAASVRRIRYSLGEMSWNMAMSRLAGVLAGGGDTKDRYQRKAAELMKEQGIRAVCYHDLGAPAGVYNFNCFDSSRIQILECRKVEGTRSWWEPDPNY